MVQPFIIIVVVLLVATNAIVRSLTRDDDLVWMALLHTSVGDASELGVVEVKDAGSTTITHT